jgi:hypothetical protein
MWGWRENTTGRHSPSLFSARRSNECSEDQLRIASRGPIVAHFLTEFAGTPRSRFAKGEVSAFCVPRCHSRKARCKIPPTGWLTVNQGFYPGKG